MVDVLGYIKKKKILFFVVAFLFFLFYNNYYVKADNLVAKAIKINKNNISIKVSDEIKLSYLLTPVKSKDQVRWGSSDNRVVRVDSVGKVKAVKKGEADVIVYLKNNVAIRDKCHVVVKDRSDIKKVNFEKKSVVIEKGMIGRLNIIIKPDDASSDDLLWTSSNEKVLKISKSGKVRAIDVGNAIVSVFSKNNSKIKDSCEVIVKEKVVKLKKIRLNNNSKSLTYGESYKLKVKFRPSDALDREIKYVSSNPSLVSVNDKGIIKVIKNQNGKVVVKAFSKNNKNISDKIVISTRVKLKKLSVVEPDEDLIIIDPRKEKDYDGIYLTKGFCVVHYDNELYLYLAMINKMGTKVKIRVYKRYVRDNGMTDFKLINSFKKGNKYFGYAMDMTYVSEKEKVFITGSNKGEINSFSVKDSFKGVPKISKEYFLKKGSKYAISGIAYDKIRNKYFYSGNSSFYESDDKFNVTNKYLKADGKYIKRKGINISSSSSGISINDNYLFVLRYNSNVIDKKSSISRPKNAVDVYDANSGEYIGTNIIKFDNDRYEIKALDYYSDGCFLIYCYEKGKYKSYIKKIRLKVD